MPNAGDFASLDELANAAHRYRLSTRVIRWSEEIPVAAPPAIIAVVVRGNRRHFIAALESHGAQILVRDGLRQEWVPTSELRRRGWDGGALHIARDAEALAALVPNGCNAQRLIYAAAAGLFSAAGFILLRTRRGFLP